MIITCVLSQNVPYRDEAGVSQMCTLRPGSHNYPQLRPKNDPLLADTLRVLRKHHKISFDDLLPSDLEVLKSVPPGVDRIEYLAEKVLLKPNPKGRKNPGKKTGKAVKNGSNPRPRSENKPAETVGKTQDLSEKQGKVSGKK